MRGRKASCGAGRREVPMPPSAALVLGLLALAAHAESPGQELAAGAGGASVGAADVVWSHDTGG